MTLLLSVAAPAGEVERHLGPGPDGQGGGTAIPKSYS